MNASSSDPAASPPSGKVAARLSGPPTTRRPSRSRVGGRLRRWLDQTRRDPEVTGLVLSGGGSGAGFQLGALRYLYDEVGITPSVITGTSAGSILASLLAQAETHDDQRAVLADIEQVALKFRQTSDMMTALPWYAELVKLMPAWQRSRAGHPPAPANHPGAWHPQIPHPTPRASTAKASIPVAIPGSSPAESTSVLDRLTVIWAMGRSGTNFDALLDGAQHERSMFVPGPIFDWLLDPAIFNPARLAASKTVLRIAVVSLESGELRYVTGSGAVLDRDNQPLDMPAVPILDAIRASCSIPAVFPPVRLGTEHYIDGGTRENVPHKLAASHLGVQRCYVVVSLPDALAPETSYAQRDMLSIVLRSTSGIMAAEIQYDEVAGARAAGATVIAPKINLLDAIAVDPGLLAIATDYGYLCAAEACQGATDEEQTLTRDVIELRRSIWKVEGELFGPHPASDSDTHSKGHAALIDLKLQLRDLVRRVPSNRLADGASGWWQRWEDHDFALDAPVTWV